MMRKKQLFRSLLLSLMIMLPGAAWAELQLRISKTSNRGIPIVIAPMPGGAHAVIEADLKRSGRFKVGDSRIATNMALFGSTIAPGRLKQLGAAFLVRARRKDGFFDVELVSAINGKAEASYRLREDRNNRRRVAHQAADKVYERIVKKKGAFDTRLVYVTVNGNNINNRVYRLYVSDADGYNPKMIVNSGKPIMSPSWSPNGRKVAYVSFERGVPAIFVQDIFTGGRQMVSSRRGINGAPSWSPSGSQLALSLSVDGNPEIYSLNLNNNVFSRLTQSRGIDTEPNWSQDGKSIIFTSDRGGRPQLYKMPAGGGAARRMTFDGSYNAAPDVVGNKISFVRRVSGAFRIAVMEQGQRGASVVSNGRFDESPSLAPNGTMVVYATQNGGRGTLSVVSDNGYARQELFSPGGDVREPAWSPYIN